MTLRKFFTGALLCAAPLALCSSASAQDLRSIRVASGLSSPVYATYAPGDATRLYIVQQGASGTAQIRILNLTTGTLNANPFLTLSGIQTGGERGLLGLAFHPDWPNTARFYVNFTAAVSGANSSVVREYGIIDADTANSADFRNIIVYGQPFANHNGGWLGFGPDDLLYIPTGDGGSANDPGNRAQDPNSPLGKILRLDISGDDFPADPNANYRIPADNPLVGAPGLDEIWGLGLRNPFRCSFDRLTGDFWIGDVGQDAREEVSFQPANTPGTLPGQLGYQGGRNYGWRCREGNICTPSATCVGTLCTDPVFIDPVHWYTNTGSFISVTGGVVYRGSAIPDLYGKYIFADFGANVIWTFTYSGGPGPQAVTAVNTQLSPAANGGTINSVVAFGEDLAGEIYIVDIGGEIFKVIARCTGDFNLDGKTDDSDLGLLLSAFGTSNGGDLDGDGDTDDSDLGVLLANFGCPNS